MILCFFLFPNCSFTVRPWTYTYTEQLIWDIATELGWPWSPSKHFAFSSIFTYIGFIWDLNAKTVHIPDKKNTKFLAKLLVWDVGNSVTTLECDSIIGTLNHCCSVVIGGYSHLPTLYHFCASFKNLQNLHSWHKIMKSVTSDISWWHAHLSAEWCGMAITCKPAPHVSEIFVDASTSWGIGFIMDGKWLAWPLIPGWKSDNCDIGWVEMVAVELALHAIITAGIQNAHLIFCSDNSGVVGAMKVAMSCNYQQNGIL